MKKPVILASALLLTSLCGCVSPYRYGYYDAYYNDGYYGGAYGDRYGYNDGYSGEYYGRYDHRNAAPQYDPYDRRYQNYRDWQRGY